MLGPVSFALSEAQTEVAQLIVALYSPISSHNVLAFICLLVKCSVQDTTSMIYAESLIYMRVAVEMEM